MAFYRIFFYFEVDEETFFFSKKNPRTKETKETLRKMTNLTGFKREMILNNDPSSKIEKWI